MIEFLALLPPLLWTTLRVSTPLVFAALGGMFSESSGIANIALEGTMLVGAFGAASVTLATHSPFLGILGGIGAGIALSMVYGFCVISLRANQIVAGTAINLLAAGLTPLLSKAFFHSTTSTPSLPVALRLPFDPIWVALFLVLWSAFWMYHTPLGLWVRFAGEHPEALSAAGVSVRQVRWVSLIFCGTCAGLGGASLSLFLASSFSRNMTAGRGFMALAALIFGQWRPIPTALACLFFGFFDALQARLQGVVLWGENPVPVQFIQILPYVFTVLVLAGWVGQARPPRALGVAENESP